MSQKPRPLDTAITKMFELDYPIIAAPMFLVSNEAMVVAAAQAGGMGAFPALNYRPIETFRDVLQKIKKQASTGFAVNLIVQKSNIHQQAQLEIALEEEVPLIITSLGSPRKTIEKCRGTKTKVFCDVVGLGHARKVAELGADGLIAVGSGAGGHGGPNSLFALLPELKREIGLPLVAAGCISGGKGLLAALALGADGIYMGTRFIASKEAQVQPAYKEAIVRAKLEDIVTTDRVDGFDGNFIKTEGIKKLLKPNVVDDLFSRHPKVKRWVSMARAGRALFGSTEQKLSYKNVFSAGQGVGSIDSVKSVEEIIRDTMEEYYSLGEGICKGSAPSGA